ncbi:helix-turn-helix domain-containing protein [Natronobacterium gregoryi]|uniref:Bacterio-opsin activator n=2 Tax=Natronobacterium gregoryi TaxID=44930 RepID=L0AEH9_NATGS|nr:helix-turn-helix domain-containing protein [Natronobacterium gregoryi]AFZ71542.1 putative DNA binding protein [Natronobacterium gregoryi SP2]ELY66599.1 Bacterio-opsin activator HTH domain protein [Natronobacterium gregoryi SP2]PLK21312.1 bacterio-opsin activator [Natronobacterium gregoryi SP2]SFI82465.1 Predicted DNA binding protein, contains HTH domain [Natronobacterium gregoryi]
MTSIADIELPADGAGLDELFEAVPSLTCEMERVIASSGHGLWLSGPSQDAVEDALDDASAISEYALINGDEDRWLYDIEFDPDTVDPLEAVLEEHGTVLSASASNGTWLLSVRVVEREHVSALYDRFVDHDVSPTIVRLFDLEEDTHSQCGLTARQYETLVAAIDHGYFEIPREVSMQELSDELDISHQALSERLRRAYRALVTSELDVTEEETNPPPMLSD